MVAFGLWRGTFLEGTGFVGRVWLREIPVWASLSLGHFVQSDGIAARIGKAGSVLLLGRGSVDGMGFARVLGWSGVSDIERVYLRSWGGLDGMGFVCLLGLGGIGDVGPTWELCLARMGLLDVLSHLSVARSGVEMAVGATIGLGAGMNCFHVPLKALVEVEPFIAHAALLWVGNVGDLVCFLASVKLLGTSE